MRLMIRTSGTQLEHIIHPIHNLMQHKDDFAINQAKAFKGPFDSGFVAAEG